MRSTLLFAVILFCVPSAEATGLFRVGLGYVSSSTTSNGTTTTNTRQDLDFAGGYVWSNRVNLFGAYATETDTNSSSTDKRTSYGAGLGWSSKEAIGPYVAATYYLHSTLNSGGTEMQGTGYQLDLGLKLELSKLTLLVGFAYANFSYTKNAVGPISPPYGQNHVDPRVGLQFEF